MILHQRLAAHAALHRNMVQLPETCADIPLHMSEYGGFGPLLKIQTLVDSLDQSFLCNPEPTSLHTRFWTFSSPRVTSIKYSWLVKRLHNPLLLANPDTPRYRHDSKAGFPA